MTAQAPLELVMLLTSVVMVSQVLGCDGSSERVGNSSLHEKRNTQDVEDLASKVLTTHEYKTRLYDWTPERLLNWELRTSLVEVTGHV